ncbi:MAG: biotin/lipoyl-containing protein, partial [Pseudomonadota bacterium]
KPDAARLLVKALKEETGLPVHFHTHDTAGIALASILAASEAGVDAVDCAMDALSGNTSQATLGTLVEALKHSDRATGLDIDAIRRISNYWEAVRAHYLAFESGMQSPSSEVYLHEMPGGQFTNLKAQARSMGLEDRWHEVAKTYADVNHMFGDVIKVTPIAKTVGDLALMLVSQGVTCEELLNSDAEFAFPDSVVTLMKGNVGQAHGGFPKDIVQKVLKGEKPIVDRPGSLLKPADLEAERARLQDTFREDIDDEDLNGYMMYPQVFEGYLTRHALYGPVRTLPTRTFFYGMIPGEEISVEIEPGVTLEIRCQAIAETTDEGVAKVFFELNGQPRIIRVKDRSISDASVAMAKAETGNPDHVGAPMPGVVASIAVEAGTAIKKGDLMLTIEAMKMETGIHAERDATIKAVHVTTGAQIDAKDLLVELD